MFLAQKTSKAFSFPSAFAAIALALSCMPFVSAQGILIIDSDRITDWRLPRPLPRPMPRPEPIVPNPPLLYRTKQVDIDARIINSVARVQLSQTFVNTGSQIVEARCVIPLPHDAVVNDLTFLVDGKEIEGKVLSADKAREIYQSYVRRSKDPALVQWIGSGLLQTNVFPIPPGAERTVTLSFAQVVHKSNGMIDWQMPLRAAGYSSQPVEKIKVNVYLEDTQPIGNIYSPTHSVIIERKGDKQATIRYTASSDIPNTNFRLLAATATQTLAANWLGYRPDSNDAGYFMMLLHPSFKAEINEAPKDIVLLLDKSGSMRGEKMDQARDALLYVLKNLPKKDRFGIVVYDGIVATYRDQLMDASDGNAIDGAKAFVNSLSATGSTNIDQALTTALKMVERSDRTSYIVHLSDGVATVGERDERQITANAVKHNGRHSHIFNFGVGHDVNSKLMNRLSTECFGQTFYVAPEENIEAVVSGLYDRLGQPALTDVRWEVVNHDGRDIGELTMVYPTRLADLFSGDQATVMGRFRGRGEGRLILTGKLGGKEIRYEQPIDLGQANSRSEGNFIASLWASRRAASIIDEIDLEGRKESLINELVQLAQRYGILTQYTAFLAEEPTANRPLAERRREVDDRLRTLDTESGVDAFSQRLSNAGLKKLDNLAESERLQRQSSDLSASGPSNGSTPSGFGVGGVAGGRGGRGAGGGFRGAGGAAAPAAAIPLYKSNPTDLSGSPVRRVGDRAFFNRNNKWIDSELGDKVPDKLTKVERFSDEYFRLLDKYADILKPMIDSDDPIVIKLGEIVYEI